ncbi:MAG: excinuclease ABC subunit UvrA, partial [Candidatus Macondimonas sp.]
MQSIRIRGARTHNLKNVDLDLPRDKLICITGLSGSGKSSLAFDTLYAEGQRRYVESLSAYARQFLSLMDKPDVDHIEGLSPAISIEQKSTSHNPRSTVGTVTEIYDYLRLLYARAGIPRCPEHGVALAAQTVSQMVDQVLALPEGLRIMLLAPVIQDRKGEHDQVFVDLRNQGLVRARVDGAVRELEEIPQLDPKRKHRIEAVVDRLRVRADAGQRLAESLETALRLSDGLAVLAFMDEPERPEQLFSARLACPHCGYSLQELEPRQFSFNNPAGACPDCDGLGVKQFFDPARVVAHPELSLAGGAVRGWDRRTAYYFNLIQSLASAYGFDVETPFAELPESVREVILRGSGERKIEFRYLSERGTEMVRRHPFEGILPNLERRHRETDSNLIREELAKFISTRPCPTCGGARLNLAARHVFIEDTSLPVLTAWSVRQAQAFFEQLNLPGRRGEIAQRICKEIAQRLDFLVNVGL